MPSPQDIDRPEAAVDVARQYLRRERPLSALVVVLFTSVFLGTFLATSLLPALVVGAALIVGARAPLIRSHGTVRLRTDDGVKHVTESFTSPTPPVLVFQWGIADEITSRNSVVTYTISHLFGLRSVEMMVQTQTTTTREGAHRVELDVTANGQQWSTYTATIHQHGDQTVVEYEYASNQRFGLRRIPQRIIAKRYRNEALRKQGYTVIERDDHCGL
jgi:hypothetical protein